MKLLFAFLIGNFSVFVGRFIEGREPLRRVFTTTEEAPQRII